MQHIEAASNLYGGIYSVLTWIFLQKLPFSIPIGHPYSQIPGRQHHATHAAGQELEKKKKKHDMSLRPIPHSTCCQMKLEWAWQNTAGEYLVSLYYYCIKPALCCLNSYLLFKIPDIHAPSFTGKSGTFSKGRDKELCVIFVLTSPTFIHMCSSFLCCHSVPDSSPYPSYYDSIGNDWPTQILAQCKNFARCALT